MNSKIQYVRKLRLSYAAKTIYFRHKKTIKFFRLIREYWIVFQYQWTSEQNINWNGWNIWLDIHAKWNFFFFGGGEGGGDVNSKVFMKNVLTEGGHIDIFSHIFTYLISLQKKSATKSCFSKRLFQKGHLKN